MLAHSAHAPNCIEAMLIVASWQNFATLHIDAGLLKYLASCPQASQDVPLSGSLNS